MKEQKKFFIASINMIFLWTFLCNYATSEKYTVTICNVQQLFLEITLHQLIHLIHLRILK